MDAQKRIQALASEQKQSLVKETSKIIQALHQDMVINQAVAVIPEAVFVEYFLDFFRNPAAYAEAPLLSKWTELAGGPYNEVNVLDALGNVLFTTPGVFTQPTVNYEHMGRYNFADIASTYLLRRKITVASATNYISSVLSGVNNEISSDIHTHIMRWVAIFDRYAKPEQSKVNNVSKSNGGIDVGILDI